MYKESKTVVRCAVGTTESFKVKVGLHQKSASSPFLFAVIMDRLMDEVRREPPWTISKTKYLCINGRNDDKTVKMEDTKVPRVKEFKYLGSTMQESGSCEREINRRLPAKVKGKVYSSVVRPTMVYGLEMVVVTKKQVEKMEVAEMKMLRFAME